jgi:hypothetical protein
MSRLLIGSSNVYRFYKPEVFTRHKEYTMLKCVDLKSFVAQMDNIDPIQTEIVISVIENFVDRAGSGKEEEIERNQAIFEATKEYLAAVEEAARKNPGSTFLLIDPILRPKVKWFDEIHDTLRKEIKDGIGLTGLPNISRSDVISRASQQFENDGVHLSKASGKIFVEGILEMARRTFEADYVDLEAGNEGTSSNVKLEDRVTKLEKDTMERRWNDNLLFARTREELDMAANKSKEDRIVITGLSSKIPAPVDREQKKVWLRNLVMETIKMVKPDFNGTLGFVNQGKSSGRDIPMVEIRLNSVEAAIGVRKAYADKRKEGDGNSLGKLYMANSVTLSTRVRVDVLKAMAKKITNIKETAYVAAYSSRPILHVRTKNAKGEDVVTRSYTFTDAIIRYGHILVKQDLDEAYKRAGTAFKGQMEQHFVVLREVSGGTHQPGPSTNRSGKRQRDDETQNNPAKKKM